VVEEEPKNGSSWKKVNEETCPYISLILRIRWGKLERITKKKKEGLIGKKKESSVLEAEKTGKKKRRRRSEIKIR